MNRLLWTIIAVLLILWLLGNVASIGPLVHILIVIALVVFVYQLVTGRKVA